MEGGHYKIIAIIQARSGSSRLPNKVLMNLPGEKKETIISHILKEISTVKLIRKTVIATTKKESDDILVESISDKCEIFRGNENDVFSRFYEIVKNTSYTHILRFTGDNPIIDVTYLNEFILNFISKKLDYSYSINLPLGCNFEMMRVEEILNAHKNTMSNFDKEHVTPYIKRLAKKVEYYNFNSYSGNKKLRLTIDYPSDYAFIYLLFSMLKGACKNLNTINGIINNFPWIINVNSLNFQKKGFQNIKEEINNIMPIIEEREMFRLKKRLLES